MKSKVLFRGVSRKHHHDERATLAKPEHGIHSAGPFEVEYALETSDVLVKVASSVMNSAFQLVSLSVSDMVVMGR